MGSLNDSMTLKIEILKPPDGTGVLRCTRQDGSVTWQKQKKHAAHFALHDLTHYAVETSLGCREAFFGLIAAGWEIEETTGNGARGALPEEATQVELIVGLFDAERASGLLWSCDDIREHAPRVLSDQDIQRIRSIRSALFRQWAQISPGGALQLTFNLAEVTTAAPDPDLLP